MNNLLELSEMAPSHQENWTQLLDLNNEVPNYGSGIVDESNMLGFQQENIFSQFF